MNKSYQELFSQRGYAYDRAMHVPAGGGYLRRYLPAFSRWEGYEPCDAFTGHEAEVDTPLSLLP